MTCPFCGHPEQRVLDSRPVPGQEAIRRRRECLRCERRFTTFERPETPRLYVLKRSGERQEFDREKVLRSMVVACRKRPVPLELLERTVLAVERELRTDFEGEVPSREIGERVLAALLRIDAVAYVRFASVYQDFETIEDFAHLIERVRAGQEGMPS